MFLTVFLRWSGSKLSHAHRFRFCLWQRILLLLIVLEEASACLSPSVDMSLAVELDLPQEQALELTRTSHQVCPYSNAVRGNIDVAVTVNGEAI